MCFSCQIAPTSAPNVISTKRKDQPMGNAIKTFAFVAVTAAVAICQADTKTTYRDAQGRIQGTVTTDRYGKTTYRDSMGRIQASQTTDRYGKTTYRDVRQDDLARWAGTSPGQCHHRPLRQDHLPRCTRQSPRHEDNEIADGGRVCAWPRSASRRDLIFCLRYLPLSS